ncbi:hypothetical protein SAMN05421759_106183 [Roseivivax lentus]|uniref:Tetratricopeptide repeat-containing protein n=1 Tax=Roseivivax lentus TaxID=633194 RepID=A0A1N7N2N5_9RHOB|nr:hypothetical protein [Roseivivax lentus]SIS92595.1 hypothetical protein SAMN05421759_106183 [Roseivivax lentus]
MNSSTADLGIAYFLDDVPGAAIPGSRLYAVFQRVDARCPLTSIQQHFLRERGYDALLQLATGKLDAEGFQKSSQKEREMRLDAKISAEQREVGERCRRDEATKRKNKALFAKRERQIERRWRRSRFGLGYIERADYGRVMRILWEVEDGNPIDADDILWLGSTGSDYWTEELRKAHHCNQAKAFTEAWHKTGDAWQAINACAQWRKADHAEKGLEVAEDALSQATGKKLRSAALTTRGGALRDLKRHQEARGAGGEAYSLTPSDFRPCTLLGAIHMEMGDYAAGADWYAKAEARGATHESVDRELQSILAAASPKERDGMKAALKSRDPHRYNWL